MPAWVLPVHGRVVIAEMPDSSPDTRIEIQACQHEPGTRCSQCDRALRRLVFPLQLMSLGCADAFPVP